MSKGFSLNFAVRHAEEFTVDLLTQEVRKSGAWLTAVELESFIPGLVASAKSLMGSHATGPFNVSVKANDKSGMPGEVSETSVSVTQASVVTPDHAPITVVMSSSPDISGDAEKAGAATTDSTTATPDPSPSEAPAETAAPSETKPDVKPTEGDAPTTE
jgi:hypothetical protein